MNHQPPPPLDRPRSSGGSIPSSSSYPLSSPTSSKPKVRTPKRTYDAAELGDSSAGSIDEPAHIRADRKRLPGVKRACNECRQQKLKCDVITEPGFGACERCRRLRLDCRIDSNFKRVGKRSKNAEMEREIQELRAQLAEQQASPTTQHPGRKTSSDAASISMSRIPSTNQYGGSEEAVASLMDLRTGGAFMKDPRGDNTIARRLGDVALSQAQAQGLFHTFFTFYHPFLPIFDPARAPDDVFEASPLLFWVMISVSARKNPPVPSLLSSLAQPLTKLLWEQISEVPQSHMLVKALCVICTWPLPISSTSSDPTFMLSGLNMQIALQIGLHRPSHAQDFSKFKVEFREEELRDRVRTWASCNAVAQRVATGYGQPPCTFYDWTLAPSGSYDAGFNLPIDAENRLMIERFSNKITEALYRSRIDPLGLAGPEERSTLVKFLAREYEEIEAKIAELDPFSTLYLRAAGLHLRLSVFFDCPTSKDYSPDLIALWRASTTFLESALNLQSPAGPAGNLLAFSTNYILQMIIASGFTILKLLNSFFVEYVDLEYGRVLFTRTIYAVRSISVMTNDLPSRLAEVLAQLWKSSGAGSRRSQHGPSDNLDNSLQLKVKCRMSMSLVFDSVWRWREEFQNQGRGNLESALKNPTNPDSAVESSVESVADQSLAPAPSTSGGIPHTGGSITPDGFYGDAHNEVFDPLNWMFDGYVDFPYSLPLNGLPEVEGQGMM